MIHSTTIESNKAERSIKALCNHFARKINAQYEGNTGCIEFQGWKCEITATPSTLTLQVQAEHSEQLERVKWVVVDHLLRFAPDEEIAFNWQVLA